MKSTIFKHGMVVVVLLSFLSAKGYSFEVDGIYYSILSDKSSVAVTYRTVSGDTYIGDIIIPEQVMYNDVMYAVTEIGYRAFYRSTSVTSITFPPTIKKIGLDAFEDANHISKVYISNLSSWCMIELDELDSSPLAYGGKLFLNGFPVTSLDELDSSCNEIGNYAFYGNTAFTNVIIPDFIERVGKCAFQGCSEMQYLEVGSNVISMGDGAFKQCKKLKTIKFRDSVAAIELGEYETNKTYTYFKDCPLTTVYTGRLINGSSFRASDLDTAIFNTDMSYMAHIFPFAKNVYIGPNCQVPWIKGMSLANLYVFTNDITDAYVASTSSNLFVIDKTNIPTKLQDFTFKQTNNLLDIVNLQFDKDYIYGSFPSLTPEQIISNVQAMNAKFDDISLNKNVGKYNDGLSFELYNSLWSTTIKIPFSYNIVAAPLTVIANNATKQFGEETPTLACSFFGFKNNETADVLTRQPNVETTATVNSPVGTYPIIVTGAEAQNYSFNYERGTLTVTKANQEIEWNQSFGSVSVGDVIELTATSTAGLPIKYSVTDESIAEIYSREGKKCVEFFKPGTVSIRANQDGNENYSEADRISKRIVVDEPEEILAFEGIMGSVGEQVAVGAKVLSENVTDPTIRWKSSDPEVAAVDGEGTVWFNAAGSAVVTAECQGYEFSVPFVVEEVMEIGRAHV